MNGFGGLGVALAILVAVTASCAPSADNPAPDRRGVMSGGATLADLGPVTQAAFLLNRVREHEIARGLMESRLIPG